MKTSAVLLVLVLTLAACGRDNTHRFSPTAATPVGDGHSANPSHGAPVNAAGAPGAAFDASGRWKGTITGTNYSFEIDLTQTDGSITGELSYDSYVGRLKFDRRGAGQVLTYEMTFTVTQDGNPCSPAVVTGVASTQIATAPLTLSTKIHGLDLPCVEANVLGRWRKAVSEYVLTLEKLS